MSKTYDQIQAEEARTWCIDEPEVRNEKLTRELVRYPRMAKLMGLNYLDTSDMVVWDIGGGPIGLSSVIPHKKRFVFDPLASEYSKYFPGTHHIQMKAEELRLTAPDLVIVTNAMDHFEDPNKFMKNLVSQLKPGAYFAHYHAINNAITHPHEAHAFNLNPDWMHEYLDGDFETVWELAYPEVRYGWVQYNGKVGQPAFCGLYRKTTGYQK